MNCSVYPPISIRNNSLVNFLPRELTKEIVEYCDERIAFVLECTGLFQIPWSISSLSNCTLTHFCATNGYLSLLKWARKQGCPWNAWTCSCAVWGGHLDILEWLFNNGCPWDNWTCFYAVKGNHANILQWAIDHGCPIHRTQCLNATCDPDIVECLKKLK